MASDAWSAKLIKGYSDLGRAVVITGEKYFLQTVQVALRVARADTPVVLPAPHDHARRAIR
jgi:hypothetical protein